MRENRIAPALDRIPEFTASATLVPASRVPVANRETIAWCLASFEEFLQRNKVRGEHKHRKLEGGGYRIVGVLLSSGRHALLTKFDTRPHFEITLDVWRDFHIFRDDFYEVFKRLNVPASTIQFCHGDMLWK